MDNGTEKVEHSMFLEYGFLLPSAVLVKPKLYNSILVSAGPLCLFPPQFFMGINSRDSTLGWYSLMLNICLLFSLLCTKPHCLLTSILYVIQ